MASTTAVRVAVSAPSSRSVDWLTPLLAAVFVLSGASGLIYQIAWVKLLSLTFGVTVYAVSTVVAAFMGGLALGSFLGGRLADRIRHPIIWYAGAEILIAGLALRSIDALQWVQTIYLALYPRDTDVASLEIVALRFGLSAVVVAMPATLMGATLPLMVRGSLLLSTDLGRRVSWLYASNTGGAIVGTVLAGFVLIGSLGVAATIQVAAVLNVAAALPAALLGLLARRETDSGRGQSDQRPPLDREILSTNSAPARSAMHAGEPVAVGATARLVVIAAFAVQGFASLAYEVVWTRVFAVLFDGSTYAFTIVLALVLLGIAAGSALVSLVISKNADWLRIYALLQAGVAGFGFASVLVISRTYGISSLLTGLPIVGQEIGEFGFLWMATVGALVVLPAMLLLGASFAIAARIVVAGHRAGRDLGMLYAGNTLGAILGASAAGFFLLPTFGSQRSLELLACVNGLIAVSLALASRRGWLLPAGLGAAVVAALVSLGTNLVPSMYDRVLLGRFPGQLEWVGEGIESTVTVMRENETGYLKMYFNGLAQASDDPDVFGFHRLLGHLPMALHPNPQNILIIGLGGGATAGALARHEPARLDIVELSDIAPIGAGFFRHINGDVLRRPNVFLKIDDGRNHLLLTERKYDVVTADLIYPRHAGASILYSYDYYKRIQRVLAPNGLMAQWLLYDPDYPDNDVLRKMITRGFAEAFPYVTMWVDASVLIGSNQPIERDNGTIEAIWQQRNLAPLLAEVGLQSPVDLRNLFLLTDAEVRAWAGQGPIMTDDRPYAEYYRSLPLPED